MSSSSLPSLSRKPKLPSNVDGGHVEKPFDASAKADLILRSVDSVDFFVLKTILSLASPVFDDMFSSAKQDPETKNGLQVIDLAEESDTLYNLLLLVYPYAKEPTNTLDMYMKVGIAAQKYAMDEAFQRLSKVVARSDVMEKEPLGTFALAVHFNWWDVIEEAAWNTLATPLRDFKRRDELQMITGADFLDLLHWRFACEQAINEILPPSGWTRLQSPVGRGRPKLIEKLHERLKDTGCPRSAVLMNEYVIAHGLSSISTSNTRNRSRANSCDEDRDVSEYQEVLENVKSLSKETDEKIAKVPFRIRDRWIVSPPTPISLSSPGIECRDDEFGLFD